MKLDNLLKEFKQKDGWVISPDFIDNNREFLQALVDKTEKQLLIQRVMPSVYVVTYNDDYGRPIFDNCFSDLKIAKEYVNDHDYLRMDETTVIKEMDFE